MHHPPAERSWFALRVRSRHERIVASALCDKGNEVFLPLYRCERRWSDRIKELELPLFPGYLFCRFDILNRLPILVTPGILHIVGIGRIEGGPLAGVEGILVVKKTPLRLVVSVTLLQRSVAVEIDHGWVTQIGAVNSRLKATDPLRPLDSLIS